MAAPKLESTDPASDDPASGAERELLRLVDAGDLTAALRLLMRAHGTAIYRYCREVLRDQALADDVHQRVFIEAHRDLPKFARRSSIRTWLFAIARHRVLDAMKSRKRALAHVDDDAETEVPDPRPRPDERIDDARLREALAICLEQLGEHVRSAVLLRFQQGFSFEEMAEVCREKPGTLQARVTRALPTLRACIEGRTGGAV
ncbi:MAG: RNA polymerase sigma factor [Kofleriaceae bacterium]